MPDGSAKPAATYPALVGNVLTQLRNQHGLHQDHVATAVGVTQATWSRIENGKAPMTVDHLRLAARALGQSPSNVLAIADQTEIVMQSSGVEVLPTRDNDQLKTALLLIGTAALALYVGAVLAKAK